MKFLNYYVENLRERELNVFKTVVLAMGRGGVKLPAAGCARLTDEVGVEPTDSLRCRVSLLV